MNDMYGRPIYGTNYAPQQQTQMRTNKIYVMSLEDALNRYADPNTIMLYRQQDEAFEYEIATDSFGKKTYKVFEVRQYSAPQRDEKATTGNVSEEEFTRLKERLTTLERKVFNKYKEERKEGGLKDD